MFSRPVATFALCALLASSPSLARAQARPQAQGQAQTQPQGQAQSQDASRIDHRMPSAILEQDRRFTVQLPASYGAQTAHDYPVLVLLDGDSSLGYADAVAEFLAQNTLVPEVITVAVPSGATRLADYMPDFAERGGVAGQADRFLDYLEQELASSDPRLALQSVNAPSSLPAERSQELDDMTEGEMAELLARKLR